MPTNRSVPSRPSLGPRLLAALAAALVLASLGPWDGELLAQAGPPEEPPAEWGPVSINLEGVEYPAPVEYLPMELYGEDVRMAYMDVTPPPGAANGETVVLFHGYNFFGAYFHEQIEALTGAGFRVVVPDRVGWGRSSKPIIPYSLHVMAANTARLLDHLGVERAAAVGHSMGGMVATRFAFSYPDRTTRLALVNSIGLEDYRLEGSWTGFQEAYRESLDRSWEDIVRGQRGYYVEWKPEYDRYLRIHYGWLQSGDWPRMARVRTLQSEVIYREPVVYDWPHIEAPALVVGGAEDGEDFPELARNAAETLPNGRVHLIPGVGHNPHLVVPEKLHEVLIPFLRSGR